MSMKASTRQVDGVTIVDLSGRITLGEGSVVLRDTVKERSIRRSHQAHADKPSTPDAYDIKNAGQKRKTDHTGEDAR